MSNVEKKPLFDVEALTEKIMKIMEPVAAFSNLNGTQAVTAGLICTVPVTIIGSLFLVISCAITGDLGFPAITALAGIQPKIAVMYGMTFSCLTLFVTVAVAINYAKRLGIDAASSAVLAIIVFFNLTGGADSSNYSASTMLIGIVSGLVSAWIIHFCKEKNLVIKLPDSVPEAIANSFASLIPYGIAIICAWLVRTVMGIDFVSIMSNFLMPLLGKADNVYMYTIDNIFNSIVWWLGIHYQSLVSAVKTPLITEWLAENSAALAAGAAWEELPHINVGYASFWAQSRTGWYYPMGLLTLTSKNKGLRELGKLFVIPLIFCVGEPLVFGLPYVFNPYMLIPGILCGISSSLISWFAWSLNLVHRAAFSAPWASPCSIAALIETGGDWRVFILMGVQILVGTLIFLPFFRAYEKSLDKKEAQEIEA